MAARGDGLFHDVMQLRVRRVSANHDALDAMELDQDREIGERADGSNAERRSAVHETNGDVLAAAGEGGAASQLSAFRGGADENGTRGARGAAHYPGVEGFNAETHGDQTEPNDDRGDAELGGDERDAAFPQRRPEGERCCQDATQEQAARIAAPVAGAVVSRDEEGDDQRNRILPTVEISRREELLDDRAHRAAEQLTLSHGAVQLAEDGEGGEVGEEQDGKAARGARKVTAQGGGRASLQPHGGLRADERHPPRRLHQTPNRTADRFE